MSGSWLKDQKRVQEQLHSAKLICNMEQKREPFKEDSSLYRAPVQVPCLFGRGGVRVATEPEPLSADASGAGGT